MSNVERTNVLDVFYHNEPAVGEGLQVDVWEFNCSNEEGPSVSTEQLVVFRANYHSQLPDLQTGGDWIMRQ